MRVSKHHYAVELARRGNDVFFLNPPRNQSLLSRRKVAITRSPDAQRLWIVDHQLGFPYQLKFHAPWLFRIGMRIHTRALLSALPSRPNIIWSFDLGRTYSLLDFPSETIKVFHPVDEPGDENAIRAADGCNAVFSVTNEILSRYSQTGAPRTYINHGLTDEFAELAREEPIAHSGVHVGLSGNFLRQDLDHETLLTIVRNNPQCTFELWGASATSNLSELGSEVAHGFIRALQNASNVILHGPVTAKELAAGYRRMDAFLICYDVQRDQSHGTNYHKLMEFLAAGHVIVSNNVTTYASRPDLVQMVAEREHNRKLPELFGRVIAQLPLHNSPNARKARQAFALDNTYAKQLDRISEAVRPLASRKTSQGHEQI
jgi:hypothetical protein